MLSSPKPISVLFVCLGNICRSTMAEGVFRSIADKSPYTSLISTVDSCGTGGWHTGNSPDSRTMAMLESNGICDYRHGARKVGRTPFGVVTTAYRSQIHNSDFSKFDYIFAMDRENLDDLQKIQRRVGGSAKVMLFGEFGGKPSPSHQPEEIDDPYYGAKDGFKLAFDQCLRFSKNFLKDTFPDIAHP